MEKSTIMNQLKSNWIDNFFGKRIYFYLSALLSVPIFLAIENYVKAINVAEDEAVSTAATAGFLIGIFEQAGMIDEPRDALLHVSWRRHVDDGPVLLRDGHRAAAGEVKTHGSR